MTNPPKKSKSLFGQMLDRYEEQQEQMKLIVCPHCQTAGKVTFRRVKRKKRPTLTRIVGATVTMGASLPITGVSNKHGAVTEMHCANCGVTWDA